MITSRKQNIDVVTENLFENVEKLKYLGLTVTNTNDNRKETKHRVNMENACY